MCLQDSNGKKKFWNNTPLIYTIMIVLGIMSGLSNNSVLKSVGHFISDVFVKFFQCISMPIIALSIIVTLSGYRSEGSMKTVWQRTMILTLLTTLIAAMVSCVLYILIKPSMIGLVHATTHLPSGQQGYLQHLENLIPSTIFSPFIEHQVLSVLLLGVVVGIAIRSIPDAEARQTITLFFKGAHGLFMVITRWIIAIIPIGLYGFITTSVVQMREGMVIKGVGEYLLVVVAANLIQGFVILPLLLKFYGIKPFASMRKMMPALSLAFFSKSSVGTLPVTMNTIEKNLEVKPEVSRFVLPLCTSLNMNGCAAFIFTTVVYLMQNHGIEVTLPMMSLWIVVSTIAAIGNAGVPMGCFFLSVSLLSSMNIPIALMGIILPFYSLIDMLETALNVWSDASVAKIIDEQERKKATVVAVDDISVVGS